MILTTLNAAAYRVHQPKWSFAPTSGAGAGAHGGRANRPGVNAPYLSLELETALAEYQQLDALLPPGLMVGYNVSLDAIVDFRGDFTSDWDALWQAFYCDWRNMHFHQGIEPPSWVIGDQVLAPGAKGILFNSAITCGANLVIYTDALTGADAISVYDPHNDLPKNQSSWQ
ncbi:RES family NAD+ phosphorylase [Massilia glaciei]|uniref:RES domain-containing protein n=1 Tax=Massilia glaciei TaxID=1524097 RepID=A0A2U2HPI4_9BURK|nr:RES family NAD+ phosphorylase [Massilia glaciei]PWF49434.1 RES domain-containing protein [Massilia glaciei]